MSIMSAQHLYDMMQPLTLTSEEKRMIIDEADHILGETFAAHEHFVAANRELPKDEWKYIKNKENIRAYRSTRNSSYGVMETSVPSTNNQIEITKPTNLPLVIATGTLAGTVEDAVFGSLGYNESLTRRRDALIKDEYDAIKILATIHLPTPEDPYRQLIVKWASRGIGALSRVRDAVFFEATGLVTDSSGDQVSYYVYHSIDNIPRITGLKHLGVVRINISTCTIVRPNDATTVELFARGFSDTRGMLAEGRGVNTIFADFVLAAIHIVECSYIKKLIWFMNTKRQAGDQFLTTTSLSSSSSDLSSPSTHSSTPSVHSSTGSSSSSNKTCGNCDAKISSFGSLLRSRLVCFACREDICHKCSVEKKIPVEVSRSFEMKLKQLTFCVRCLVEAKQVPAREVAMFDVSSS